jgi:methionyl-tRNA formyltransferase
MTDGPPGRRPERLAPESAPMGADRPRVVLVGLGATTQAALDGLVGTVEVVALVRSGDDDTVARARAAGLAVVDDATPAGVRQAVESLAPDAVVVSSFDRILPADLVERCPFVNVHYAPLPRLRGRATVNWAIINGDDEAAISIHHLVAGLDAGGILYQASVPIGGRSTVASVYEALDDLQRVHLADAVLAALAGDPGRPQDEEAATYACARLPDDGEIDWCASTIAIDRLVRALVAPFPGAFTWLGLDRVFLDAAEPLADGPRYEGRVPGRVIRVDRAGGSVDVLTGDGVLRVRRVRVGAGEAVDAATVIRSARSTLGLRTADLVSRIVQLESRHVGADAERA